MTALPIKIVSFFALSLALTQPIIAMEPQPDNIQNDFQENRGTLPLNVRNDFVEKGYELLKQIYSGNPIDLVESRLHTHFFTKYQQELSYREYSELAYLAPTSALRWLFSSTDKTYNTKRKNQMISIIAITWALEDMATKQKENFERGSFTIIDPDHRLYTFLLDYVKLTTGYENPQEAPFVTTTANFAYRREPGWYLSSHHKKHCPESQFGIDVRFKAHGAVLKLCPYDTTHILFAKLNIDNQEEPLLFLKWEDLGMGSIGATMYHSLGFMHSQSNVQDDARREKDIHPDLKIPFEKLNDIFKIVGHFENVGQLYRKAKDLKAIHDANEFFELVDEVHPNGNNHLRCGNEVILDLRKI